MDKKSPDAFRTISEVADWLGVPTHVLRFWESRFSQVKPVKRAGGRRYYRPNDMELLGGIRKLLHEDGMTIRGVQKLLREEGIKHVAAMSPPLDSNVMRDITPSNVVSLDSKSNGVKEEAVSTATPSSSQGEAPIDDAPAAEVEEHVSETAQNTEDMVAAVVSDGKAPEDSVPEAAPSDDIEVQAEAVPDANLYDQQTTEASEDLSPTDAEPKPAVESPSEVAEQAPLFGSGRVTPDAITENSSDSSVADDVPAPEDSEPKAPLADISHISADPGDDDAKGKPSLSTALRHARKSGTDAHIAALQALADRLESLNAQMGGKPGARP